VSAADPRLPGVTGWPQELVDRYTAAGYWTGETLGERIDAWAEHAPDRVAVCDGELRVTYTELAERSRRLAARLRELGIGPDDRVVVQLANTVTFCDLTLALLRIGALAIMALPPHREREVGYMIDHGEAVAIAVPAPGPKFDHVAMAVGLREEHPGLRQILVDGDPGDAPGATSLRELVTRGGSDDPPQPGPQPSDVALFLLSGGTTGLPKLIPRTHDDYLYNARASAAVCGFGPDTVYLAALPASHNFPLACPGLLGTWELGGRVVLTRDTSPDAVFALVERERVTVTAVVPALALRWTEAPSRESFDLSSLEVLQVGGARCPAELARRLEPTLGVTVQQVFGMAEGLLNYTRLDDPPEVRAETQGRPISPDDEIRIVDPFGDDVTDGEEGELLTRGPYTLRGYYRADEHNQRSFTPDGFYRTGDVVALHPSGNLIVQGRAKDLINRGGEKISAEEIENLAIAHPAVFHAAAVAMPDRALGERTCLYVVPREQAVVTLAELCRFLTEEQRIAKYKLPERLEVVAELPLTKVGKVDKVALRDDVRRKLETETEARA
jgi:2,3-dihydroxybenzoate-AMP ligase